MLDLTKARRLIEQCDNYLEVFCYSDDHGLLKLDSYLDGVWTWKVDIVNFSFTKNKFKIIFRGQVVKIGGTSSELSICPGDSIRYSYSVITS